MIQKTCPHCKKEFPRTLEFFTKAFCWCKKCQYAQSRLWRETHREQDRKNNRELMRKKKRAKSGVPDLEVPLNAVCAICEERHITKTCYQGLVPDHCHKTGKFRGWLCPKHNLIIGQLGDDFDGIRKVFEYMLDTELRLI